MRLSHGRADERAALCLRSSGREPLARLVQEETSHVPSAFLVLMVMTSTATLSATTTSATAPIDILVAARWIPSPSHTTTVGAWGRARAKSRRSALRQEATSSGLSGTCAGMSERPRRGMDVHALANEDHESPVSVSSLRQAQFDGLEGWRATRIGVARAVPHSCHDRVVDVDDGGGVVVTSFADRHCPARHSDGMTRDQKEISS